MRHTNRTRLLTVAISAAICLVAVLVAVPEKTNAVRNTVVANDKSHTDTANWVEPVIVSPVPLNKQIATLQFTDFERVNPGRPQVQTKAFTTEELVKAGGKRIVSCPNGGKCVVVTRQGKTQIKVVPQLVPIEKYAAELNEYEEFLNTLGYSLRSPQNDLGPILRLRKKKLVPAGGDPKVGKKVIYDPTIYERSGQVRTIKRLGQETVTHERNVALGPRTRTSRIRFDLPPSGGQPRQMESGSECGCPTCAPPEQTLNDVALHPVDSNGNPISSSPSNTVHLVSGSSCGAQSKNTTCQFAACLYQGTVSGFWKGISFCYPESPGNDWFGATFCAEMGSSECGGHDSLDVVNDLMVHDHLTIFGIDIPLLEGDAQIQSHNDTYTTEQNLTFLGQDIETLNLTQTIPGPGAVIPLGPVPFTITSNLQLKLSVDAPQPNFNAPAVNVCQKDGSVGISRTVSAFSAINLEASIDLVIAKAGVDGQLVIGDDQFGLGIDSNIQPSANAINVTPSLQYRTRHLAGSLSLFAEIDLLVTSKRFEIALVDLGSGFGTDHMVKKPLDTKTFKAVKTGLSF